VSVEDQGSRARILDLAQTPAAVRFISGEPLLSGLSLTDIPLNGGPDEHGIQWLFNALTGEQYFVGDLGYRHSGGGPDMAPLDWVIAGGESGPGARPMHPDWARSLRDQCAAAQVPFFFKQWGEWAPGDQVLPPLGPGDVSAAHWAEEPIPGPDGEVPYPMAFRCGKKRAGRTLDGVIHDGFPG
jgi:hypothetical protein